MRYYVVADIHGFCSETERALDAAGFFKDKEGVLLLCGDALDRGSEAQRLCSFLLSLQKEGRLIYVKGNHEGLLDSCLKQIEWGDVIEVATNGSVHCHNGTWDTLLQLSGMSEGEAVTNPDKLVKRVRESDYYRLLLPEAIDFYETENYVFVHGWIPTVREGVRPYFKHSYDPNWRNADAESWYYARWANGMELACSSFILERGKTVVCGHYHASYGHEKYEKKGRVGEPDEDFSPFYSEGIIAIDACTAVSGRVNCIVIEDNELEETEK